MKMTALVSIVGVKPKITVMNVFTYKTYGTKKLGFTFYKGLKHWGLKFYFFRTVLNIIVDRNGKS